jgi:hypothetical protein
VTRAVKRKFPIPISIIIYDIYINQRADDQCHGKLRQQVITIGSDEPGKIGFIFFLNLGKS